MIGIVILSSGNPFDLRAQDIPEWSKGAVWYQIFPERFHNADTSNDPTAERINAPDGWEISPWTGDWYQRAEWEQRMGPQFRDFVFTRRYGGDLQGVIDKIDYLDELGVTAIYFNPVFDAVTLHKYDASMFRHIDRFFGPDPEGDTAIMEQEDPADPSTWQWTSADSLFLGLIEKAHARDINIVIDGVFNHTGQDFWAFRELKQKQEAATTKNWYDVISYDDPATPDTNEFDFRGWWGYKGLPEFNEVEGNLVEPVKEHIFAISRRWMDPNGDGDPSDGIDGWRLDVTEEVGHNFWKEWHQHIRSINPDIYTTAEIWGRNAHEYINEEEFTASMNYPFLRAVHKFFIKEEFTAAQLDTSLANIRNLNAPSTNLAMQNLMASHDTERLATMIVNNDRNFKEGSKIEKSSNDYKVRKPDSTERKIQKLIALFQYTYIGSPMVYYGDEAGMWGADDPDDRKPMVWPEFTYDDEVNHPFSHNRPRDTNGFDQELHNWYRQLGQLRSERSELATGQYKYLETGEEQVFAFMRHNEHGKIAVVIINRDEEKRKINLQLPADIKRLTGSLENPLTQKSISISKDNSITFQLSPLSSAVFVN